MFTYFCPFNSLSGLILGKPFLADSVTYPWQHPSGWLDLFTVLIFFSLCVIFNIVYKGYPDPVYS